MPICPMGAITHENNFIEKSVNAAVCISTWSFAAYFYITYTNALNVT